MLRLTNLDERTRLFMTEEFDADVNAGRVFLSPRLTAKGGLTYPGLLRKAIESGSDQTLARQIGRHGLLKATEHRRKSSGADYIVARVPRNAADLLAEGEFNRYYIRGVCRRALDEGIQYVVVYRAKPVDSPRPHSRARIGQLVSAADLLQDLREHMGDDEPRLGIPGGPNSGISVRLP